MSAESLNNPLHLIIELLIQYNRALVQVHHARTAQAWEESLDVWRTCHPPVWASNPSSRNDTIRRLADPAKAWLSRINSRYVAVEDFDLVEVCAHTLSAFAISPSPMAMPDVYSKTYHTEDELWKSWNEQGNRIIALSDLIARLKELTARAGANWTQAKSSPTWMASEIIKVLLLSANPIDSPLNIDEEFRAIDQKIRNSEHREHVALIKHGAVRLEDVASLLMRHMPHVVHFSGHGAASGIALTGADGKGRVVPPDALANIFRTLKDNVRVVFLNACDSAPQAEAIVSVIDCAVGMSNEIEDDAAIAFAAAFYEVLGYGRSVQNAFDLAVVQLECAGADRSLAKLYKRQTVQPSDIILVNPSPQ